MMQAGDSSGTEWGRVFPHYPVHLNNVNPPPPAPPNTWPSAFAPSNKSFVATGASGYLRPEVISRMSAIGRSPFPNLWIAGIVEQALCLCKLSVFDDPLS